MFLKKCAELDNEQQTALLTEKDGQRAAIDTAFDFLAAQGVDVTAAKANPSRSVQMEQCHEAQGTCFCP